MESLARLAALIRQRNAVEQAITQITGRPMALGHLGETIAAQVFDIELVESASHKSLDGYFRRGPWAGRSVNVKWYAKQEWMLDITPAALPDNYLVLTGPRATSFTSRGSARPWWIDAVYLFDAAALVDTLKLAGVKLGIATSVAQAYWRAAQVYPVAAHPLFVLDAEQRQRLRLFGSTEGHTAGL